MKLYRTVTCNEFANLFLGEKMLPREQHNSVCVRILNGKEVKASDEPFEAVCTFNDKLFWATDYHDTQAILLELDVPKDRVLWTGYGVYSTYYYNHHFSPDCSWLTQGEYGHARQGMKDYKIPETYISSYSIDDVTNVYFMNGCHMSHTLDGRNYVSNNMDDLEFGDYVYRILKDISNRYVKKGLTSDERISRRKSFSWIENIDSLRNGISLNVFKKKLTSMFPETKDFIAKFQYFNSVDNLESLLAKGNLSYEVTLNPYKLTNLINDRYNKEFNISFVNLSYQDSYPSLVESIYEKIYNLVDRDLSYKSREEEVKALIYTLCLDTKIL